MEVLQPSSSSFLTQGSGQSSLHSSMLGTQLPSLASWTSRLHHARAPTPAAGTCSTSSSLPFQSSNRVAEAGSATGQAGPSSGIIPFQNYTGRSRDGDERQLPSISSILPPLRNSQIHSVRSLNLRSTPNTHHTALLSLATHSHSRHLPEGYNQSTKESKGKQAPNEEAHELETFSLLPHLQSVNDSQSRHPSRLPTRAHHFGSVAASSSAAENDVQQSNSYLSGPMSTTFSQAHTRGSTSGSATLPHLSQEPPIHSQLGLTGPQELLDLPYDGTSSFGNEYALQPLSAAFILPSSSVPSSTRSGPPSRTTGSPQLMGPPKRPATDPDSEIASGSPGYNELLSRRRTTGSRMKRKKGAAGQQSDGGQMRSLFGLATADMQRSASDAGPSKESEISSDEGDASADCIPVHHSAVKTKQPVVSNGLFLFLVTVILKGLHLGAPMLGSPWASSSSKLTTSSDIRSSGNNISQQLLPFMAQTSPTASVIGPAST
ncbi:unnamed protein product [Tilletia controversa]|nr:unnamed protein product [Tilletia controversa]CAD6964461.1 unnamed protein product [Tilletia caries]